MKKIYIYYHQKDNCFDIFSSSKHVFSLKPCNLLLDHFFWPKVYVYELEN